MSSPMFSGLVGINAAREITAREETLADKLVEIGEGAIEKYQSGIKLYDYNTHHKTYSALTKELTLPEYNADTLQQLIFTYANQKKDTKEAAIVRGLYTGMLASELTERNARKGKRTKIFLNGGGNDFPYLLYFAHTLDEVVVESFNGDCILSYAGSDGGSVKNAVLKDITGDDTGASIVRNGGRAGTVTLAGITGYGAGVWIAGYGGRAGPVTLAGIKGNGAGAWIAGISGRAGPVTLVDIKGNWAGADIARNGGRAGPVTLAGITGYGAGAWIAGISGRADIVTLAGITGDGAGVGIAGYGGRVARLFAGDNEGKEHFTGYKGEIIPLQQHKNAKKIEALLQKLKEENEPERLAVISQQLAKAIKGVRG